MQDEGVFVKIKEGVPDDSKDIWFSVKDEGLADLSKDITNSLRVSEVGENLEEDHVRGIVELNQALAGEPEGVTCYEITPTEQFKASKASEPKFEIAYTSTYCMDTEKNLLTRLTFNLTETAPSELDSGEPGQLDVEASTDIKFSDFGVKVDFPKLDLSKFAAENKVGEGTGADGAPGAPGGSEDGKKDKESDVDLSGEPGEPGDNSAFRNDRFAFIFVGLSMLAFM
ncbi:hypothetical protein BSKO_08945 [Bryopsis sp. KO-2023]|nr:hypothetical protein BSKO_08945 [Bryopsis sp. KO-2023]